MKEVLTESQSHTSAHILLLRADLSFVRVMIFIDVFIRLSSSCYQTAAVDIKGEGRLRAREQNVGLIST